MLHKVNFSSSFGICVHQRTSYQVYPFPFLPTLPLIVHLKSHIFILPTFNSVVTYGLSCHCLGNLIKAMLMSLVSCQTIFLVFMTVILSQEPVILLLAYLTVTIKTINIYYALTLPYFQWYAGKCLGTGIKYTRLL